MKSVKLSGRARPCQLFKVSEQIKCLEPPQLQAYERSFEQWKNEAKRADSVLARTRLWLIFLMLRHSGARLGEVLSLDDSTCFDVRERRVCFGKGGRSREVPFPADIFSTVMDVLEGPMGCGLRGDFFHVDQGYFRRICYARGRESGLPRELAGPNVLRNTRAVELLRSGVPITVVKEVLGQSSLNLTEAFQQFTQEDMHSIVKKSVRKQTSARNSFVGHVVQVESDSVMAEVVMETRSGITISSVITTGSLHNLEIGVGTPVAATVKAPLVNVLRCEDSPKGSARNRLRATIVRVTETPVLSEVVGTLPNGTEVCALISAQSTAALAPHPGDEVEFWFKALSVVLNSV